MGSQASRSRSNIEIGGGGASSSEVNRVRRLWASAKSSASLTIITAAAAVRNAASTVSARRRVRRKVLLLSLDAAGKTSFLNHIKYGESKQTIPTIGFNQEDVTYRSTVFSFWDVGGQDGLREHWKHYFFGAQGVIFMIDSNDQDRLEEAKGVLRKVIAHMQGTESAQKPVLLILANKIDLPESLSLVQLYYMLELDKLDEVDRAIMKCCVKTGTGLQEALHWLHQALKKKFR